MDIVSFRREVGWSEMGLSMEMVLREAHPFKYIILLFAGCHWSVCHAMK